jgi:hypothetical protein
MAKGGISGYRLMKGGGGRGDQRRVVAGKFGELTY